MAPPVANGGEPSTRPPESPYEDYLLARGLRYLTSCKHQRNEFYNQFLQLFISAFKFPHDCATHGYVWGIDIKVIDYLIDSVCQGELPGIEVRLNAGAGAIPKIKPEELEQRPDPSLVVLFSSAADEETTVRIICKHILKQQSRAYDRKSGHYKGYPPGRLAPWIIGYIELIGLYENGFTGLPKYAKRRLKKEHKLPEVANLFIDNLCNCHPPSIVPVPGRTPPAPKPASDRPLVRVEVHHPKNHTTNLERDKCYLCSPFSIHNRVPDCTITQGRFDMAKKGEMKARAEAGAESSASSNAHHQKHVSNDAETARKGKQPLRPTAAAATEAAKKDAVQFTINSLVKAGYPVGALDELFGEGAPLDVSDILREMNLGGDGAGDDHDDHTQGKGKGKAKEYVHDDDEGRDITDKGKGKDKAKEVHHAAYKGGPAPASTVNGHGPARSASGRATALPTITITPDSEAEAEAASSASTVIPTGLTKTQKRAALRRAKKQLAREMAAQEESGN